MHQNLPELDEIYADTWIRRDSVLGSFSYAQYLESEHWQQVKAKASARPNYQKCEFCDSQNVELHHTSYKWIWTEHELRTIISLCRDHHQEIHVLAKEKGISVRVATSSLRRIYKPNFWLPNRVASKN